MGRGLESRRVGGVRAEETPTATADARPSAVRRVSTEPKWGLLGTAEQLELASEDAQDMCAARPSRSLSDDCSSAESGLEGLIVTSGAKEPSGKFVNKKGSRSVAVGYDVKKIRYETNKSMMSVVTFVNLALP